MADKRISQLVDRGTVANNDVVPIVVSGATTTNKATISSIQTFMQGNLDLGVTSVGITLGSSGTDVNVSGSPITSSGNITINLPTASATNRGLLSSADWTTFNSKQQAITLTTTGTSGAATLVSGALNIPNYSTDLSGYVTLGTTQTITAQKTFTTSGSSDTMIISHGSGSGFALDVLKAGNGEAIRVTKSSGSGNAMTISGGNFEAPTIVKTGGTSSQFLMADGSVNTSVLASGAYLPLTGGTLSNNLFITGGGLQVSGSASANRQVVELYTSSTVSRLAASYVGSSSYGDLELLTGGLARLTLASTGAATFSSSVTAGGKLTINNTGENILFSSLGTSAGFLHWSSAGVDMYLGNESSTGGSIFAGSSSYASVFGNKDNKNLEFFSGGRVLTITSSGAATFSSSVTATSGLINGTTDAFFDLNRNASGSAGRVRFQTAGTDEFEIGLKGGVAGFHITKGDATELVTVSTGGNVGIGTITPTDFGSTYKVLSIDGAGGGGVLDLMNTGVRTLTLAVDGGEASISSRVSGNPLIFKTNNAGTVATRLTIASTGAATFSSSVTATSFSNAGLQSGEVFNGTKSNAGYFVGYLQNTSATGLGLYIQNGNDANDALRIGNSAGSANNIQLYGSGKAYFAGNVGIGTASPTKRLNVEASVAGEVTNIKNTRNNASGDYALVTELGSNCNNTNNYHYIAGTGGADKFYIYGNGNVVNINNSYGSLSDIKLKENIQDASPKLDDLMKVKVRNYNLIGDDKKQIGVIAQELEEVFPAMIDESEDFEEVEIPQVDEEGNEILNEEGEAQTTKERVSKGTSTKSVKYSVFVPMLIKAMQEQQEQIKVLTEQIDSLKNQMQ